MAYIEGRVVHDADAHVMETADWVRDHADPAVRDRLAPLRHTAVDKDPDRADEIIDRWIRKGHDDPDLRAREAAEIMERKNWKAVGSILPEDRGRAIDHMGVASQLVFNTFHNGALLRLEHGDDLDLAYGAATAHNRAIVEFCAADARLLPTCYVPLADFERSRAAAAEAIAMGAAALLVASACPRHHSPSHKDLDPVWAQAEEAGIPIVYHVGGGGPLLSPSYFRNGEPIPPDFHGGDENFRSVDSIAIAPPVMQHLAALIFDGILERHPALKFGVIEQGAAWVPSWMRTMESSFDAFERHEDRLRRLSLRPSEYVRRQVRVTPFPTEDVGWIVDEAGTEVPLFSTDYPHVEGGRRPFERFEASLGDRPEAVRHAVYCTNFEDLMGAGLPAPLRAPAAA